MPKATWLGHSCVLLEEGDHRIIIDPFLTHNPKCAIHADNVQVDHILVTHGHTDHFGDTEAIARRCDATVIANFELGEICGRMGLKVHAMHIGGSHTFPFGRVKLTIAHHGGGFGPDAAIYAGPPVGFLVEIGGKTVYHPGDTGLFYDMKLIGEMNDIDLAFLPIGDYYTMGIEDAVKATEFLKPKTVVPFHFDTFDIIKSDPNDFASRVKGSKVMVMKPGDTLDF